MNPEDIPRTIQFDAYVPDYNLPCCNCGMVPTVMVEVGGQIIHHTKMCGPCTWGIADTIDPANW